MKTNKIPAIVFISLFLGFIFAFGCIAIFKTPDVLSKSERRELAKMPEISAETVMSGSYFTDFEKYLLDQFPLRNDFRTIKSVTRFYALHQKDNHGIFIENGSAAKISYPLSGKSVEVYIKKLNTLYTDYLTAAGVNVYQTVIPDKAAYLADEAGCPAIDYAALIEKIKAQAPGTYIDIFDTLCSDSYYKTDTHWSQDKIIPTADKLLSAMGAAKISGSYIKNTLSPFYGVYYGQSALPLAPDKIFTVSTPQIDTAEVYRANKKTGALEPAKVYYDEDIEADDAYDVFLGGAATITVIDNTEVSGGKTLYLFSDSFGRSLAPLLLSDYDRVVVIDLRHIKMSRVLETIALDAGSDVLFAYSISAIDVSSNLQVN